jgi:hypothetical protein
MRKKGEETERFLGVAFVKRLLVEETVGKDSESVEGIADCVTQLPAGGQDEDSSRLHFLIPDSRSDDLGNPLGFILEGAPLHQKHVAIRIPW